MYKRLLIPFGCYAGLALLASAILDGPFRLAVWVFLAGLAVKTWLALLRG